MDEIASLDMRGLTLDERKELLRWYVTDLKKLQTRSEIEDMVEQHKLLEEAKQNHPEVFEEDEEEEYVPNPIVNIKTTSRPSANEYTQISGTLKDITDETVEKIVNATKEMKKSIIE